MSFKHRVVSEEDDPRILECDSVESLDNLGVVAEQLRKDAAYFESRFPADANGFGTASRPICAELTDAHPKDMESHVERQMKLCLTQVSAVLAEKEQVKKEQKEQVRSKRWGRISIGAGVAVLLLGIALMALQQATKAPINNFASTSTASDTAPVSDEFASGMPALEADRDLAAFTVTANSEVASKLASATIAYSAEASADNEPKLHDKEEANVVVASDFFKHIATQTTQTMPGIQKTESSESLPTFSGVQEDLIRASAPEIEVLLDFYQADSLGSDSVIFEF